MRLSLYIVPRFNQLPSFMLSTTPSLNSDPNDSETTALNMDIVTAQEGPFEETMKQLTPNKVFSHWVEMDKEMARENAEIILKQVWSGLEAGMQIFDYAPTSEHSERDLKYYISPDDFDLSKPAQTYEIWWTFLPEWRLRRVGDMIVGILRTYGWELSYICVKCCEDKSVGVEWEISVPQDCR